MTRLFSQKGVTLIEVLVGFVIFTASLVAVLDYVTEQVYLHRLSSSNFEKVKLIYDLSAVSNSLPGKLSPLELQHRNLDWDVSAVTMDSVSKRAEEVSLKRYDYRVSGANNVLEWSVYKMSNESQSIASR